MEEINFNQLKRLWNLKLVAETGSIKRAATRANVTSSAISQSITSLEDIVGRKLLLRKKDQLLPTEYGTQLLRSAEAAFGMCADLQKQMSGTCQVLPKMTWLDFAATESLAVDLLPELMKRLRKQFPGIRLKVRSGRSSCLTKLVKKAELCMAVVEENDFIEGMTTIPISEDRLGFYCSTRLAEDVSLFDVLGVATIQPGPEGHALYYTRFLKRLGKGFKPTLVSESYEILRSAAVEGSVIAVLPSRVAGRRPGELKEVFPDPAARDTATAVGRYKIYLVSEPGCTPEENVYLAQELQSLISGQN